MLCSCKCVELKLEGFVSKLEALEPCYKYLAYSSFIPEAVLLCCKNPEVEGLRKHFKRSSHHLTQNQFTV